MDISLYSCDHEIYKSVYPQFTFVFELHNRENGSDNAFKITTWKALVKKFTKVLKIELQFSAYAILRSVVLKQFELKRHSREMEKETSRCPYFNIHRYTL